ncbi:hypothetical protein J4423_01210 [Candidatus Pacearchaeota archaeon]|nr:hypothetical protein [Candidatus Pacearchaeota archaeon]
MKNSKLIILIIALSVIFIGIVSALEVKKSEIIVKTEPSINISVTVINPNTNEELQTFSGKSKKFGEYRFTYYGVVNQISLSASIMGNDTQQVIKNEKFGPYNLGTPTITINFTLSEPEENEIIEADVTNETSNITESETNQSQGRSPILGFVTRANIKFSKTYYYVGAGALGLIILIIILKRRITVKSPMEPNPNKIKTDKKTQSKTEVTVAVQNTAPLNSADTEKRISELQKELEQIKSEEKLVQLQRQVFKERQELNKLRSEKEFKAQDFKDNSKIK